MNSKLFLLSSILFLSFPTLVLAQNNSVVSDQCFNQIANGLNGNPNHDNKIISSGQSGCDHGSHENSDHNNGDIYYNNGGINGILVIPYGYENYGYQLNPNINNNLPALPQPQTATPAPGADFGYGDPNVVNNLNK
jgi:hypothetical protein